MALNKLNCALSRITNRTIKFRLRKQIVPVQVTSTFIEESLRAYSSDYVTDNKFKSEQMSRYRLDSTYWTCTKKEFLRIIDYSKINERKLLMRERFDSDNFALPFKNQVAIDFGLNNIGLVVDYLGGHTYNLVVFSNGDVELFEPHDGGFPIKGSTPMYSFKEGVILL